MEDQPRFVRLRFGDQMSDRHLDALPPELADVVRVVVDELDADLA